jgi:hypothetical protein
VVSQGIDLIDVTLTDIVATFGWVVAYESANRDAAKLMAVDK